MTRSRTITFGVVNVVLTRRPHTPERYIELFENVFRKRRKADLHGDWVGLLGQMKVEEYSSTGPVIRGGFYKYVDLDATRDWYNVVEGKPAEKEELGKLVIPKDLKPHFQILPFVFFAKGHRLVSLTGDGDDRMSSAQVAKVLKEILRTEEVQEQFGPTEVTVEPSLDTLEQILSMPRLRKLELDVTRPNPDDFEEFENDFFQQMDEQNASSLRIELVADRAETLSPNENTKKLARLAQSNGKVVGIGGMRGETKTLSTAAHPFVEKDSYLPDLESRTDMVFERAIGIFNKVMNRP